MGWTSKSESPDFAFGIPIDIAGTQQRTDVYHFDRSHSSEQIAKVKIVDLCKEELAGVMPARV